MPRVTKLSHSSLSSLRMGGCCEQEADVPSAALQGTQRAQKKDKDCSTAPMRTGARPSNPRSRNGSGGGVNREALGSTAA